MFPYVMLTNLFDILFTYLTHLGKFVHAARFQGKLQKQMWLQSYNEALCCDNSQWNYSVSIHTIKSLEFFFPFKLLLLFHVN